MTAIRKSEISLASGSVATVLRLDPQQLEVLPLFLQATTAAESNIAAEISMARQRHAAEEAGISLSSGEMVPTPPPDVMLESPEDLESPIGKLRVYSRRALAALRRDQFQIAPLHLFRLLAHGLKKGELLLNANHFLFLPPEVEGLWNASGDPIGFVAAAGTIEMPAQLGRACLIDNGNDFEIRRLGFTDQLIGLPDASEVAAHPFGPPVHEERMQAFSLFHGSRDGSTPVTGGVYDVSYVGRYPLALKEGGGMPLPSAGCVIRFTDFHTADAAARGGRITYKPGFPLRSGVQAGPIIVEEGRSTRQPGRDIFVEESVAHGMPLPDKAVQSPYAWKADWADTRAARLAAGIDGDKNLFFCAVEGTSSFVAEGQPVTGATLDDLAQLMVDEGAITAMHLDGGASTQCFGPAGGALIQPKDIHHGIDAYEAQYDRPLPLALKLR